MHPDTAAQHVWTLLTALQAQGRSYRVKLHPRVHAALQAREPDLHQHFPGLASILEDHRVHFHVTTAAAFEERA